MRLIVLSFTTALIALIAPSTLTAQGQEQTVAEVVKTSSDAVVLIVVADSAGREIALASGFLVKPDGKILTNYHVIQGGHSAVAKLSNGSFFPVDGLLGYDQGGDLALLKVSGKNLPFLKLADSDKLQIGEHVVAIGSPLGLENTVSDGIVSALREAEKGRSWIQTTVPVSHGNSGGPLLRTSDGAVVGIIDWQVNPSFGQNLNFAIPINAAKLLISSSETLTSFDSVAANPAREAVTDSPQSAPPRSAPEILAGAKTIFVSVRSGSPVLGSEITKKLLAWGRLTVVTSQGQADLVLEILQTGQLNVAAGAGNQATAALKSYQDGVDLWSVTKGGGWAMSGWSNAWVGRSIAGDLIKFLDTGLKKKI
jgi:S1-C subfamily serine protease